MAGIPERCVVCEGREDAAFFEELARVLPLPEYLVRTIGDGGGGPGVDGLFDYLKGLVGITGFRQNVRDVVLLLDSEADQDATFAAVVTHIKNANGSTDVGNFYAVPKAPFKTASGGAPCSMTVILQPVDAKMGCLETVLWRYLMRKYPDETKCIEDMIACAGLSKPDSGWTAAKQDKARLRAAIGVLYKENPNCATRYLWARDKPIAVDHQLIPLDQPEFSAISDLLKAL